MKFEIIIDTGEKRIDILYAGYNIISETIYNDKIPEKIVKLLETETSDKIKNIIELER
jgi:hypothetical protein